MERATTGKARQSCLSWSCKEHFASLLHVRKPILPLSAVVSISSLKDTLKDSVVPSGDYIFPHILALPCSTHAQTFENPDLNQLFSLLHLDKTIESRSVYKLIPSL